MAAVVRVKRRISEDPAEALLISCKRQRQDGGSDSAGIDSDGRIRFSYAGTLNSRDVPVSKQIRDAIRKDQLQAQYKQHVNNISETCRSNSRAAAKASRYKVVCGRRAGGLDGNNEASESDTGNASAGERTNLGCEAENHSVRTCDEILQTVGSNSDDQATLVAVDSDETESHLAVPGTVSDSVQLENQTESEIDVSQVHNGSNDGFGEGDLCVYDVEQDDEREEQDEDENNSAEDSSGPSQQVSNSGITVNGVELVRERLQPVRRGRSAEGYVYDLYYTNNPDYDFRALENILSIQALHDELVLQGDRDEDCEEVYEDEDDSNDEDNWRNDYPDEDPRFYENDTAEYYYGEDMLAREPEAFDYGADDDLADWMSARCNVVDEENMPSDDEDEDLLDSVKERRSNLH